MSETKRIECKVAGVSFEGRQELIDLLFGYEDVLVRPEPDNAYDANALAVVVNEQRIGYIPRDLAAELAPLVNGEDFAGSIIELTGKPGKHGVVISFDVPAGADGS